MATRWKMRWPNVFHVEIATKTNVTTDDDDDKIGTKIDYIERWGGEMTIWIVYEH